MKPISETAAAIAEYGPFDFQNRALADRLTQITAEVRAEVPECVGLSVTLRELEVTFTLVASELDVAVLDAVQYVDGGPCVDAIMSGTVISTHDDDPLDEKQWQIFCTAKAAHGIASTLSMPIMDSGIVVGGFNLYGSTTTCFDGHHDDLARVLGAWAGGAVTNADLSFGTRDIARRAPAVLQQSVDLTVVSSMLAAKSGGTDPARWEDRIRTAAARAGIPLAQLIASLRDALRRTQEDC